MGALFTGVRGMGILGSWISALRSSQKFAFKEFSAVLMRVHSWQRVPWAGWRRGREQTVTAPVAAVVSQRKGMHPTIPHRWEISRRCSDRFTGLEDAGGYDRNAQRAPQRVAVTQSKGRRVNPGRGNR